ncbi:MAG: hypothetical protein R3314_10375, partial [Longimicrobiales bacterium]|nr:hypothetical protein [Longimicrobiales bacterium]
MMATGERTMRALAVGLLVAALTAGCGGESEMTTQATGVTSESFGTVDGDTVMLYTVRNASGIQ